MSSEHKRIKRSITTHEKSSSAGSKKFSDPELQSFTKRTHRFESHSHHHSSKLEKLTIQTLCEKVGFAMDHFYSDDLSGFYFDCKEFLSKGVDSWKQKIVDRMSTYEYLQLAFQHKPYTDIESEIIKQWKKNSLLYAILIFWYNSVQKSYFNSLKQFKKTYDIFREFVAQISHLVFKPWLINWEKKMEKNNVSALNKLFQETTHFIITESSQFKCVYQEIIVPLIDTEFRGTEINFQYDLNALDTKKCVFDLEREENLTNTIEALKKFTKAVKLSKKIQLLREYRLTLEQEINLRQQEIQLTQGHTQIEVLQKDDFISALIYCIIRGNLQQIRYSLLYMTTLLGADLDILSKLKIKVYFDDLLVVNDFLTIIRLTEEEERGLRKIDIDRRNNVVSTPEIEDIEFEDIESNLPPLKSAKYLTQVQKPTNLLSTLKC